MSDVIGNKLSELIAVNKEILEAVESIQGTSRFGMALELGQFAKLDKLSSNMGGIGGGSGGGGGVPGFVGPITSQADMGMQKFQHAIDQERMAAVDKSANRLFESVMQRMPGDADQPMVKRMSNFMDGEQNNMGPPPPRVNQDPALNFNAHSAFKKAGQAMQDMAGEEGAAGAAGKAGGASKGMGAVGKAAGVLATIEVGRQVYNATTGHGFTSNNLGALSRIHTESQNSGEWGKMLAAIPSMMATTARQIGPASMAIARSAVGWGVK